MTRFGFRKSFRVIEFIFGFRKVFRHRDKKSVDVAIKKVIDIACEKSDPESRDLEGRKSDRKT